MKSKWATIVIAASMFVVVAGQASAQVAGSTPLGVSVEEASLIVNGWSVKKTFIGKPVFNDQNQKVGVVHDIIIAPDNMVSFAIVAAHQFLGVSAHDVAVPMSQIDAVDGKLVWAGATRDTVKAMPKFQYSRVRPAPVARKDYEHH
jgi:sporulation protein YlmC with PRC-barrel domain